jgi:hypothetical protein
MTTETKPISEWELQDSGIKYAHKYGQLNGLIIMLGVFAKDATGDELARHVAYTVNRAKEIDHE